MWVMWGCWPRRRWVSGCGACVLWAGEGKGRQTQPTPLQSPCVTLAPCLHLLPPPLQYIVEVYGKEFGKHLMGIFYGGHAQLLLCQVGFLGGCSHGSAMHMYRSSHEGVCWLYQSHGSGAWHRMAPSNAHQQEFHGLLLFPTGVCAVHNNPSGYWLGVLLDAAPLWHHVLCRWVGPGAQGEVDMTGACFFSHAPGYDPLPHLHVDGHSCCHPLRLQPHRHPARPLEQGAMGLDRTTCTGFQHSPVLQPKSFPFPFIHRHPACAPGARGHGPGPCCLRRYQRHGRRKVRHKVHRQQVHDPGLHCALCQLAANPRVQASHRGVPSGADYYGQSGRVPGMRHAPFGVSRHVRSVPCVFGCGAHC